MREGTRWGGVREGELNDMLNPTRPVTHHHDEFVGIDVTVVKMKALELVDLKNRDSELATGFKVRDKGVEESGMTQ